LGTNEWLVATENKGTRRAETVGEATEFRTGNAIDSYGNRDFLHACATRTSADNAKP
jgi:hypothetical protein